MCSILPLFRENSLAPLLAVPVRLHLWHAADLYYNGGLRDAINSVKDPKLSVNPLGTDEFGPDLLILEYTSCERLYLDLGYRI